MRIFVVASGGIFNKDNRAKPIMNEEAHKGPGLPVHPPVMYLAVLLVGVGLNHWRAISPIPGQLGDIMGVVLIVLGVGIMPPVLIRYCRLCTPFNPHKPASALITDGPYQFSRNPAYVALTLWYLGIALLLNNGWVLLMAIPLVIVMDRLAIPREEQHLKAKFGQEYRRYESTVRRWF
jgi:protein-S-isoprenylcysteine O-methyltransferase Ste14